MKLIFAFALTAAGLYAAPVNNDLWQFSNSGFSVISLSPDSTCGAAANLFGANAAGLTDGNPLCPIENANGTLVLSDSFGGITTLEWNTALMSITSMELTISNTQENRPLDRFQLAAWNGVSYTQVYDSGSNAFAFGNLSFPITLASPVQASRWQATFTNLPAQFTGARLVELDGFGSLVTQNAVPEPGSAVLAMMGLGLILAARMRRS